VRKPHTCVVGASAVRGCREARVKERAHDARLPAVATEVVDGAVVAGEGVLGAGLLWVEC